jgi:inhibitor of KinA
VTAAHIEPYGDSALLLVLGERLDESVNRQVHALAAQLVDRLDPAAGWQHPVPSYASLLVPYDPLRLDLAQATAAVRDALRDTAAAETAETAALMDVPVRYGGQDGPDLGAVARAVGLSTEEVVRLHSTRTYRVYAVGFVPGFAYLGRLAAELHLPRREEVRRRVPAGSVGIAGEQTGIYPTETPGGWHLIGRTELRFWDPAAAAPTSLAPGNRVRFVPIE